MELRRCEYCGQRRECRLVFVPRPELLVHVQTSAVDPEALVLAREEAEEMAELLDRMPERDAQILYLRYDGQERTLEEIGQEFWITRERVRQLIHAAENRLCFIYGVPPVHPMKTESLEQHAKRVAYQAEYRARKKAERA